jgi:hypothetical protein
MDDVTRTVVFAAIAGGIAGGLAVIALSLLRPLRRCSDCYTPLPLHRMRARHGL